MYDIDFILYQIKDDCFNNGGCGFDFKGKSFHWWDCYHSKKRLFSYVWEYETSTRDSTLKEMKEYERVLKKLPKGISFSRQDMTVDKSLPNDVPHMEHESVYLHYDIQYIIHVSDDYSKKIVASAGKRRTFITNSEISPKFISQAEDFKSKVQSNYMNIVKDMYNAVKKYYYDLNYLGIGKRFDGCHESEIDFSAYGMKPLSEAYQVLGFALAITEYGAPYLQDTEFFKLDLHISEYDSHVFIDIVGTKRPDPNAGLNDW